MLIRYIIETRREEDCPNCTGAEAHKQYVYLHALPDGTPVELQAGDVYFSQVHGPDPEAAKSYGCPWTNCDGKHLYVLCPDKDRSWHAWNVDGRANNCTMKEDTAHRCWVRHGDPAVPGSLHVDKKGHTCQAGAGSIQTGSWHGFLHHGDLHP